MKFSKTKLAGFGFIALAVGGFFTGSMDVEAAIKTALTGIAIIGGRAAIDKNRL